jgi:hypothetical protein
MNAPSLQSINREEQRPYLSATYAINKLRYSDGNLSASCKEGATCRNRSSFSCVSAWSTKEIDRSLLVSNRKQTASNISRLFLNSRISPAEAAADAAAELEGSAVCERAEAEEDKKADEDEEEVLIDR